MGLSEGQVLPITCFITLTPPSNPHCGSCSVFMTVWFGMRMNKWLKTWDMLIACYITRLSQATKGHQVSPSVSDPFAMESKLKEKASRFL